MSDACCPVCGSYQIITAEPLRNKNKRVLALRFSCEKCGYTDRTNMFKGALSLSGIRVVDKDFRNENEQFNTIMNAV